MPLILAGIDEAGYGPLLGPLAIVCVEAQAEDHEALVAGFAAAAPVVRDSKTVHTAGDIRAIETVALASIAWLTGDVPPTAAACFALLGEGIADRADSPWMEGAESLPLPVAAEPPAPWSIPGVAPLAMRGALVHPAAMNAAARDGINRAAIQAAHVARLLAAGPAAGARRTLVDRLGGRRYYRDVLRAAWPRARIEVLDETPRCSSYRCHPPAGGARADGAARPRDHAHHIAFQVDGEAASPLTAMAGCIAKYARELHMHLFNRHWSRRCPGLGATAGYAVDARRWLDQAGIGAGHPLHDSLVRLR